VFLLAVYFIMNTVTVISKSMTVLYAYDVQPLIEDGRLPTLAHLLGTHYLTI